MGCSIKTNGVVEEKINNGLLKGHAYGILDVTILKTKDGKEFELVLIRNPHGMTEWNGDWSDDSEQMDIYREELLDHL